MNTMNISVYFLIIFLINDSHQGRIQKRDHFATLGGKYIPGKIQYDDYSQFARLFTDIIPMRNGLPPINLIQRMFFNKPSTVQKTLASKNSKIDETKEKHEKRIKELSITLSKLYNQVWGTRKCFYLFLKKWCESRIEEHDHQWTLANIVILFLFQLTKLLEFCEINLNVFPNGQSEVCDRVGVVVLTKYSLIQLIHEGFLGTLTLWKLISWWKWRIALADVRDLVF